MCFKEEGCSSKVLAVIVTYNRLSELKNCIKYVQEQSFVDFDLLVVNNGSNDGTREFLDGLDAKIFVIHQENLGGAGGFFTGMKFMFESQYEWLWLMDDDGIPDVHQLESLLKYNGPELYRNALVLNKDDHQSFAFPNRKDPKISDVISTGKIIDFAHPFNGTLFHRQMIKKIGFIKKEMFIWGDEVEYTMRARENGFFPITIANAIHYHPKEKGIKVNVFPFITRIKIVKKPTRLSHHYYRNRGFIDATYESLFSSIKFVIYHTIYFVRVFEFRELRKFYSYYFKGRKNVYN